MGSTEADEGDYDRDKSYLMGCETVEFQQKGKKRYQVKNLEVKDSVNDLLDDLKEAGSGTEEQKLSAAKGKLQTKVLYGKSARPVVKGQWKRSKKTLFGIGMQVNAFKPSAVSPLFFSSSLCKVLSLYACVSEPDYCVVS